jgi:type I restriction enzyme S subunit
MREGNSELPAGWASTPLKDLIARDGLFNDGDWVESKDQDPTGDVRLIQLADIGDGVFRDRSERFLTAAKAQELQCTFLRTGDVLISRLANPLGRACIFPEQPKPCVAAVDVCIFRSGSVSVDHNWLMHFINSIYFRDEIELRSSGTTRTRISRKNLGDIEMRVPPLAEQRRIVAKIETLRERSRRAREALSEVEPLLQQFRQSVLAAAFRGDLTADWRAAHPNVEPASELLHRIRAERRRRWEQAELAKYEVKGQKPPQNWKDRYKEPESVDDSGLPELPEGWCWARFDEILYELRNGVSPKPNDTPLGTPILRINSVRPRKVLLDELRYLPNADNYIKTYRLRDQDLLFTRYNGTLELVGVCGLVQGLGDRVVLYPDKLMRVRIEHQLVLPEFIEMYFASPRARQRITKRAKTTSGQQGVSGADIKAQPVPLVPFPEQQQLITRLQMLLSMSDGIEATLSKTDEDLDNFDQSILTKAFLGDLVPQDPSDEPASVLLERIHAQSKRQVKAPKQASKSQQPSKLEKKSPRLEPQQLTLTEVLRSSD